MKYKGEFTYKEVILVLAKLAMDKNLLKPKDLQRMVNSERNYHRVKRALRESKGFMLTNGREVYLGEQC
jgi:hypothetical protein